MLQSRWDKCFYKNYLPLFKLLLFLLEEKKSFPHLNFFLQGSPQQLQQLKVQRQLQLFQKQSVGGSQRVALQPVAGGKVSNKSFNNVLIDSISQGLPAQLIVQGQAGGKGLPATVTVQQLQQIVKSVAGGGPGQPTQQVKPWLSSFASSST